MLTKTMARPTTLAPEAPIEEARWRRWTQSRGASLSSRRPPRVTAAQIARAMAVILAGLVYADGRDVKLWLCRSAEPLARLAQTGVDQTPTATIKTTAAATAPLSEH